VSAQVLKRFGAAPRKGGASDRYDASVNWATLVLRDYVLPELKPNVVFSWMTEPDHIQHGYGAGAPESVASIRNDDAQLGRVLQTLESRGLRDKTNIIVVSDHGYGQTVFDVNVAQELAAAGFVHSGSPEDLVIASSGQTVALHVQDHDPARIKAIVEYLQRQPWTGLVFTADKPDGELHEGGVAGTFSLEFAHLGGHERSPDIVFTFPWSSQRNRHGVPGADYNFVTAGKSGPVSVDTANHGSISPWTVRNTMLAWGPDFKRGATLRTPTSNVDVTPTLLYLLGHADVVATLQGRPMLEALAGGPDEEQVVMETDSLRVRNGDYEAVLQVSDVEGKRYLDKGWRTR
jgi:arylsulfatase A-like enzyme